MSIREFDEAYVVSDLHIGGPPGFQMFASSKRFLEFGRYLEKRLSDLRKKSRSAELLLVINGDFVDFLAEQQPNYFVQHNAVDLLHTILDDKSRFRDVRNMLQRFVARSGAHLVVVLGNHDLELALPDCREAFLEILTGGRKDRRSRVELCFDGWGYRFRTGGKTALCLHGNETDKFNFTRYDELNRICGELSTLGRSDFGRQWIPSAGTKFVVDAVNPLKQKHPFVDLLHPMIPLVPTVLGLLNPDNIRFADEAAELMGRAVSNELKRPASQRRMLSTTMLPATGTLLADDSPFEEPDRTNTEQSAAEIVERVERALREGRIDNLIAFEREYARASLGRTDWLQNLRDAASRFRDRTVDLARTSVDRLNDARKAAHRHTMRTVLLKLVADELDVPTQLSAEDAAIESTIGGQYDVIFIGHTHHRRLAPRSSGTGIHVNTGTWADRMTLLARDVGDGNRFADVYEALISTDRAAITDAALGLVRRECTVAVLGRLPRQSQHRVSLGRVAEESGRFEIELSEPLN